MTAPRFAVVLGGAGSRAEHIISIDRVVSIDAQSGDPDQYLGRAFCGYDSDSYWTEWGFYATIDTMCKRCLRSWVRACTTETDMGARRELQNLLAHEEVA